MHYMLATAEIYYSKWTYIININLHYTLAIAVYDMHTILSSKRVSIAVSCALSLILILTYRVVVLNMYILRTNPLHT